MSKRKADDIFLTEPVKSNRISWDEFFMGVVEILTRRSMCLKYKTATVITNGTQIVSIGYNGTTEKNVECCEYWQEYWQENIAGKTETELSYEEWKQSDEFKRLHREWSRNNEIHAESNALKYISKADVNSGYTLYTLYSPCDLCAKEIISYGIKTVKYLHKYPSGDDAINKLQLHGVRCVQIIS